MSEILFGYIHDYKRLTIGALQGSVCSLRDSTYPVVLVDMSGAIDRAIGTNCDWFKTRDQWNPMPIT